MASAGVMMDPLPEAPLPREVTGAASPPGQTTVRPGEAPGASREVAGGRWLLRAAMRRRMGPLQRLDAGLYLAVNGWPHPQRLDRLARTITVWTTGGWIWAGATFIAWLLGVPRSRRALVELLPSMMAATWIVEYPIKTFFRRRRPFIKNVRALVVGKRPGSWSFPSGHTASSFACAWVLSTVWPRSAPAFFTLASAVGFSRIYVGAHYPGDVLSGAFFGLAIAEAVRRLTRRLVGHTDP
jgi:undecaprenyl-diphosphatase